MTRAIAADCRRRKLPIVRFQEGCMFALLLVACVGDRVCEYERTPAIYADEASCAKQAAIIAGMAHAHIDIFGELSYHYSCNLAAAAAQQPAPTGKSI
jgi:hypothetical protein